MRDCRWVNSADIREKKDLLNLENKLVGECRTWHSPILMERRTMEKVYFVDVGVLINKEDPNYEPYSCYDKEYGYFDEDQSLCADLEKAIQDCTEYVFKGVEGTYGIVTEQNVTKDQFLQIKQHDKTGEPEDSIPIHQLHPDYTPDSIVFSICKKQGITIENFIR